MKMSRFAHLLVVLSCVSCPRRCRCRCLLCCMCHPLAFFPVRFVCLCLCVDLLRLRVEDVQPQQQCVVCVRWFVCPLCVFLHRRTQGPLVCVSVSGRLCLSRFCLRNVDAGVSLSFSADPFAPPLSVLRRFDLSAVSFTHCPLPLLCSAWSSLTRSRPTRSSRVYPLLPSAFSRQRPFALSPVLNTDGSVNGSCSTVERPSLFVAQRGSHEPASNESFYPAPPWRLSALKHLFLHLSPGHNRVFKRQPNAFPRRCFATNSN